MFLSGLWSTTTIRKKLRGDLSGQAAAVKIVDAVRARTCLGGLSLKKLARSGTFIFVKKGSAKGSAKKAIKEAPSLLPQPIYYSLAAARRHQDLDNTTILSRTLK